VLARNTGGRRWRQDPPGATLSIRGGRIPIHPDTEALTRYRDGELTESQRAAAEAHLERCSQCRAAYGRLCREADAPGAHATAPDAAMMSQVLANIDRWEEAQSEPERQGEALKQRVASDLEPFLGTEGTDRVLQSVSGGEENLLPAVESVLAVFLGRKTASLLVNDIVDHAIFLKGSLRRATRKWSFGDLKRNLPAGWGQLILVAACCFVALGVTAAAVWVVTGDPSWVGGFVRLPGTLAAVGLASIELWCSLRVIREFAPGEALRPAWMLIASSAVCNLASALLSEGLGERPQANLLANLGLTLGGTFRFALLAAGLYYALKVYRQSGFLERLRVFDWLLLAIPAGYVLRNTGELAMAARLGRRPEIWAALRWLVDPLLCLLLWQSLLLFRSVRKMGPGWISRCWGSYSTGIFLTSLGNIGLWAAGNGYLPRQVLSLTWYAWLPAAAAFALAPAYQLEAIRDATTRGKST